MNIDEGWRSTRGSQCCASTDPPQKTLCHWDWGEGVAGFDLVQKKKGRGCDYHEVDDDDDDNSDDGGGKGEKRGKKYS
jgi:hypothetical protein